MAPDFPINSFWTRPYTPPEPKKHRPNPRRKTRPECFRPAENPSYTDPVPSTPTPEYVRLVPDDTVEQLIADYAVFWRTWAAEQAAKQQHDSSTERPT